MSRAGPGARLLPIDILKVVASQLIVLHHLAFYGPMADHAAPLLPGLFDWLAAHARIAVQVFLVVGGFLAGQRLLPGRPMPGRGLSAQLVDRYLRLALPLAAALLLAIAGAALARLWMVHDSIPAAPTPAQLLWNLTLLQDLVGADALSAGVWYVAIAFQLHVLLLLVVAAVPAADASGVRSLRPAAVAWLPWLLAAGVALSALWFNRWSSGDVAAPYFLGAYGLGVLVAWSGCGRMARLACGAAMLGVAAALVVEWRDRLGLALVLAVGLWIWQGWLQRRSGRPSDRSPAPESWPTRAVAALSRSSFALFLVHFPVALVVNALFTRYLPATPWPQMAGVVLAWLASIAAGELFFRRIERPLMRLVDRRRAAVGTVPAGYRA